MNPYIGEGHVFHARRERMENQFRYPSFFLLFDVSKEEELHRVLKRKFRGVLAFQAKDHLRGEAESAEAAVREFLKAKVDYEPEQIWLQTMPRMLGYVFNPVSFWLLRKENRLDAVLVEVNNTFGERHFYWLKSADGRSLDGQWLKATKSFHVSPFQPVDGYYEFRFLISDKSSSIDIVYRAPDGALRLATWLKGQLAPLASRGSWSLFRKYGWMTVFVPVRIHLQALKLWRGKVPFHSKPELPKEEMTA